ncbi:hypothetical protein BGI41_07470 [Methanobrevibacter sp. 87.7]|uniref:aspartate/glutamate racemase family protein n=1 Tax=Methanobrevibacter sp. 87.7 TaxID=387957 RepID=UPI000B5040B8|nr:amino acid racemase [Methanobrevibacter sp. 87.7]OWT32475.1 hypothetical protein BGI41_07470 [Methanobrevibacter sp. 87.7]
MKTLGLIGGIGPASTVKYYENIVYTFKNTREDEYYPHILISSLNMEEFIRQLDFEDYNQVEKILLKEINNLENAGADIIAIASNTAHVVIDELKQDSNIPIISIINCIINEIIKKDYKKVLITGTSFIMTHDFYIKKLEENGIRCIIPNSNDIQKIHEIIYPNLENGIVLPYKKEDYINIINKITENEDIDCLLLACNELNLLINDDDINIPIIDSSKIHIKRILKEITKK